MKVKYRPNDRLEFEIEGTQQKELFEKLGELDEIFGEAVCGNCEDENLAFRVRKVTPKEGKNKGKTFAYYELVCRDCGHFLAFGQHQQNGTLFPKRKIEVDGQEVYDKERKGWRPPLRREELEGQGEE